MPLLKALSDVFWAVTIIVFVCKELELLTNMRDDYTCVSHCQLCSPAYLWFCLHYSDLEDNSLFVPYVYLSPYDCLCKINSTCFVNYCSQLCPPTVNCLNDQHSIRYSRWHKQLPKPNWKTARLGFESGPTAIWAKR